MDREEKRSRREEVEQLIKNALQAGGSAVGKTMTPPTHELKVHPLTGGFDMSSHVPTGNASTAPVGSGTSRATNAPDGIQAHLQTITGNTEAAHRDWIIARESSGKTTAKNPNSSAFGLGQIIKANREAYGQRLGIDPNTTDREEQLRLMDAYVKERYGTYANARKFWEKNNWY